ncbi:hypothetical protein BDP27DRAFT_1412869 [Rhodocollybia butyracea]|uniref:Uncharacterized protein n=1 Tax=Rhodocollybia butyracea TaxID=206335 RepID=A0A9P5QB02_9AGAR|nr:hypothetical protein BDP27DRAFT_1412869 [Rhodocollybia butyracea]
MAGLLQPEPQYSATDHSLGFQMFVGRGHSLKPKGMRNLRKPLKAFVPDRDWKINKIGFVFVVPIGYKAEVEVPQKRFFDMDFFTLEVDVPSSAYQYFTREERCPDGDDSDSDSDIETEEEELSDNE